MSSYIVIYRFDHIGWLEAQGKACSTRGRLVALVVLKFLLIVHVAILRLDYIRPTARLQLNPARGDEWL